MRGETSGARTATIMMIRLVMCGTMTVFALAFEMSAPTAGHALPSSRYTGLELGCRRVIAKTFTRAVAVGNRSIARCHMQRDREGGSTDCNVLDIANADATERFARAQDNIVRGVLDACSTAGIDGTVRSQFLSCPEPCTSQLGLPNPLTSYDDLSQCLRCLAREVAQDVGAAMQGSPAGVPLQDPESTCDSAIGKAYGRYLATVMTERTRCQNREEFSGATALADTGCLEADPSLKIADTAAKAASSIDARCAAASLTALDSCTNTTAEDLVSCLSFLAESSGNLAVSYAYGLPATVCPVGIDWLVGAGDSDTGEQATTLALGWTGGAHTLGVPLTVVGTEVNCGSASTPCGECTINGLTTTGPEHAAFLRCSNDVTIGCDVAFADDSKCGGARCLYVLGPPLPAVIGNTPTCSLNWVTEEISGTAEPDSGASAISLDLLTRVYRGESLMNPCPICVGDRWALDGVKDGVCETGASAGSACDVHGFSEGFQEDLSLDCPPSPTMNYSGSGRAVSFELTTDYSLLGFDSLCDSSLGETACACGVCSGDATLACRNDDDCAAKSAGTCAPVSTQRSNACDDGECTDIGGGRGVCLAGPMDSFCDGVMDGRGNPVVECATDDDCDALATECGGYCGGCTVTRERSCFAGPIIVAGTPSPTSPVMVASFCAPPMADAAINDAVGLPGPATITIYPASLLRY